MYGDIVSLPDALLISVIAMIIVFLALGAIYAILLIFRKIFTEKQKPIVAQISERDGDDEELTAVLMAAIHAYENDMR
jgi:undecaprenyl pyrophosphate phosphatase UppP